MQASLTWQLSSKYVQFAYEQGQQQKEDQNDYEQQIAKSSQKNKDDGSLSGYTEQSYDVSRQVIDFQNKSTELEMLNIITQSELLLDQVSGACIFTRKQQLPKMTVTLLGQLKNQSESNGTSYKKYCELFLSEKSRHTDYEKYRINKQGLFGKTRIRIKKDTPAIFQKIRFNYSSEKIAKLIIVLYQVGADNKRKYKSVMVSNQITVLKQHKVVVIDSIDNLRVYFQDQSHNNSFLDNKYPYTATKISSQVSAQKISEQIRYFQTYLTKKSKKNANLLYIISKYSDISDLYFLAGGKEKSNHERFTQLWKQALNSFKQQSSNLEGEKTCNYLHPQAKFVLKINAPLPHAKIVVRKKLTNILSIIASDNSFDCCDGKWIKLHTTSALPARVQPTSKVNNNNDIPTSRASVVGSVQAVQMAQGGSNNNNNLNHTAPFHAIPHKKHGHSHGNGNGQGRQDDEQFNQVQSDDQDDDGQYAGDQSQNQSLSKNRKRGRRIGQKKQHQYKKNSYTHLRENRYSTRNRVKNNDDEDVGHDKKAAMNKKIKDKQINLRQNNSSQQPNLPFKILTPNQVNQLPRNNTATSQEGNNNKSGMMNMGNMVFPMSNPMSNSMANPITNQMNNQMGKKPDDKPNAGQNMPKGSFMMPMPMGGANQQQMFQMMSGFGGMPGVQMFPMGNGMQAVMVPMQMDKMPQNSQGTGQMPLQMMGGMPMMMPGNSGNNSMYGGGGGMPQGFMMQMPGMMPEKNNGQKSAQQQKSKSSQTQLPKKDDKKNDNFPPVSSMDMSKMGYMGQMPGMQNGMMPYQQMMMPGSMGGQGSQYMQMGMPGSMMGGMMGGGMTPMMGMPMPMPKPNSQNKEESKQNPAMMMPQMQGSGTGFGGSGGNFPFYMMAGNSNTEGQSSGQFMPMGMMPPGFMQGFQGSNQTSSQQQTQPTQQQQQQQNMGMPQGMMINMNMMNPEAMQQMMRNMNPQQQQQMFMQMKGMGGAFPMQKNDGNDNNKK